MVRIKIVSGFIFLLLFQAVGIEAAMAFSKQDPSGLATPSSVPEELSVPEFQAPFLEYLFGEKYTLLLGTDRGACAYRIDPTDVHERGGTRFVTAVVTGSDRGHACHGYLNFQVFQADCESNTLYTVRRETEGDRRWRGWERLPTSLSIDDRRADLETSLDGIEQSPAETICGLPLASTSGSEATTESLPSE